MGKWFKTDYPAGKGIPTGAWMNAIGAFLNRLCGGFIQGDGVYVQVQSSANGIVISGTPGQSSLRVQFGAALSVVSFYNGTIYAGVLTGTPPEGLTAGQPCYICNLNEANLSTGQAPTQPGEWSRGDIAGLFTDPATGITLPLVEVDHPASGNCD